MKRRDLLTAAGLATIGAGLAGCSQPSSGEAPAKAAADDAVRHWKMVTTWPANFPGLGTGAANLARRITEASGGRLNVTVYAGGELVPPFEVFDAVSRGTAEMGHGASYYWKGKAPAAPFFSAVPFGMNAQEMNGWLHYGGGLELWREVYAPFNLLPFPAGNSGVQMAGWFRREINSLADLQGLKMRIPGLGGEVMARIDVTPVNLPGAEIFTALQSGAIDATEWVGPYNDLAFGLHRVAKLCYYPGWHEPGSVLECMVNKDAYEALPDDLQALVASCCQSINNDMLAEFSARNQQAMKTLVEEHGVEFRPLPDDVLAALKTATTATLAAIAASDALAQRVLSAYQTFQQAAQAYSTVSEGAYLQARARA